MKILLVDDHQIIRKAYIHLISDLIGRKIEFAEAQNGFEAIEKLQNSKFDIVFLDVSMPEMNGYEACAIIRQKHPALPIIMLTQFDSPSLILHFYKLGVSSFLIKTANISEIELAITHVVNGEKYFPEEIARIIHKALDSDISKRVELTSQEMRLIRFLRCGHTSKEIASHMKLTSKTIDTYRERLLEKTKTINVAQLISFGFETGILF